MRNRVPPAVKQAHWNIKGQNFIGLHELLDDAADHLRDIPDEMAERAVILGGIARGTSQNVVAQSGMESYPVEETDIARTSRHLRSAIERSTRSSVRPFRTPQKLATRARPTF